MSDRFLDCLPVTLAYEGGYVFDKDDPGGATNHGVTQKVYDEWRVHRNLPRQSVKLIGDDEVRTLYRTNYWDAAGCNDLTPPLDLMHFDAAVNHGITRAVKFLTASDKTANGYLVVREAFYHALVKQKPVLAKFERGWLNRVDDLRHRI